MPTREELFGLLPHTIVDLDEETALALGVTINIARRQMSPEQIRELQKRLRRDREQQKKVALALRQAGKSQEEAATAVGVTDRTIRNWEKGEGISIGNLPFTYTPPDLKIKVPKREYETIYERVEAGESQSAIAADYKIKQARVSQIVKQVGKQNQSSRRRSELAEEGAKLVPPEGIRIESGDFRELGENIPPDSIDLIFTEMEVHEENIYNLCNSAFRLASNKTVSVELWGRVEQRKIRYRGWHLLVLSNTRPDNSEWMLWNKNYYISERQLVRILRFELDPHTLHSRAPESTATTAPPKASTELEQLRLNWKQVVAQAPEDTKRTPVIAILRSASVKPVAFEDNTVVLSFRYPLHKEKMEEPENQRVAEKIIGSFLGHPCRVRCTYEPEDNHLVQAALKMGAQIIDVEKK